MIVFKKEAALHQYIATLKQSHNSIGFIPTMGALHQGHLSLIKASKEQCDITVCSIFVNPTQFNDPTDFDKYPITIEQDLLLLTEHNTDVLFLPAVDEIYPSGTGALPPYELGEIEVILEGKYRPGHFQGVCQVVDKLMHVIQPDNIFFGQKDYQQCMVINKLIALKKLPVKMYIHPTVRERDGLAMSSRNMRLSPEGRKKSATLYRALKQVSERIFELEISSLKKDASDQLLAVGFEKIDYLEVADAASLQTLSGLNKAKPAVVLAAAFIDGVRLIDNIIVPV